jgi:hypothetical protein
LATIYDLFQRQCEAGDAIVLKNIEAQPFVITEIGEIAVNPGPGAPPMRVIKVTAQITVMQPFDKPFIDAYLVKKGEKVLAGVVN